jgi:hypothetical protein
MVLFELEPSGDLFSSTTRHPSETIHPVHTFHQFLNMVDTSTALQAENQISESISAIVVVSPIPLFRTMRPTISSSFRSSFSSSESRLLAYLLRDTFPLFSCLPRGVYHAVYTPFRYANLLYQSPQANSSDITPVLLA